MQQKCTRMQTQESGSILQGRDDILNTNATIVTAGRAGGGRGCQKSEGMRTHACSVMTRPTRTGKQ